MRSTQGLILAEPQIYARSEAKSILAGGGGTVEHTYFTSTKAGTLID